MSLVTTTGKCPRCSLNTLKGDDCLLAQAGTGRRCPMGAPATAPDFPTRLALAAAKAAEIAKTIDILNVSIKDAGALGVQVTMFVGEDGDVLADIAVLHRTRQFVMTRIEVPIETDPA